MRSIVEQIPSCHHGVGDVLDTRQKAFGHLRQGSPGADARRRGQGGCVAWGRSSCAARASSGAPSPNRRGRGQLEQAGRRCIGRYPQVRASAGHQLAAEQIGFGSNRRQNSDARHAQLPAPRTSACCVRPTTGCWPLRWRAGPPAPSSRTFSGGRMGGGQGLADAALQDLGADPDPMHTCRAQGSSSPAQHLLRRSLLAALGCGPLPMARIWPNLFRKNRTRAACGPGSGTWRNAASSASAAAARSGRHGPIAIMARRVSSRIWLACCWSLHGPASPAEAPCSVPR